jgi:hypothetical protein
MQITRIGLAILAAAFGMSTQTAGGLRIDSPEANTAVSGIVEITGAADSAGMIRFRLDFAYDPNPTGTWFPMSESAVPVQSGLLGIWDTTTIREGTYILRLTAYFGNDSAIAVEKPGIRVYHSFPLIPESVLGPPTPDGSTGSSVPRQAGIVFPAPTASPSSGIYASQTVQAETLVLPLAIGAGTAAAAFIAWLIGERWVLWNRRRRIRAARKSGNRNE